MQSFFNYHCLKWYINPYLAFFAVLCPICKFPGRWNEFPKSSSMYRIDQIHQVHIVFVAAYHKFGGSCIHIWITKTGQCVATSICTYMIYTYMLVLPHIKWARHMHFRADAARFVPVARHLGPQTHTHTSYNEYGIWKFAFGCLTSECSKAKWCVWVALKG